MPVRLDGELVLSGQYQWKDAYIFNPDSVNIFGPQDKLNSIESWPTIPYIRTDIDEDFQDVIALRSEAPAITTEVRDVILTAHVDQVTEKEIFVPIPLADSLKNKIRIFPAEVLVKITLGLSQYDQVSSEDFKLQLLEDTSMANRRKVVVSKLPNSVRYVSHTPEYVDYYRSIIESSDDAK